MGVSGGGVGRLGHGCRGRRGGIQGNMGSSPGPCLLGVCPWATHSTIPNLSFFFCKMGVKTSVACGGYEEKNKIKCMELLCNAELGN